MTSEYRVNREPIFQELRVNMKISSVLGDTFRQLPQERVWMHTSESAENPLSTALTLQQSKYAPSRSYVILYFFAGPNPPQTDREWVAKGHMGIHFEFAPRILAALGEELQPNLPRDLTTKDSLNETVNDAGKIAQTAKTIFDKLGTPAGIATLVEQLEASQEHSSRLLCMTVSGQQALGIKIS